MKIRVAEKDDARAEVTLGEHIFHIPYLDLNRIGWMFINCAEAHVSRAADDPKREPQEYNG